MCRIVRLRIVGIGVIIIIIGVGVVIIVVVVERAAKTRSIVILTLYYNNYIKLRLNNCLVCSITLVHHGYDALTVYLLA